MTPNSKETSRLSVGQADYEALVEIVAVIAYSLCSEDSDGKAFLGHGCENNFNAFCDMLARLGVMKEHSSGLSHRFDDAWTPCRPLIVRRHSCEPGAEDLMLAAMFFVDWFPLAFGELAPTPDEKQPELFELEPDKLLSAQIEFRNWAVRKAGCWLLENDAALWVEGEGLAHAHQFEGHRILNPYWSHRREQKIRVGNSEDALFPISTD
ncbi:MAG: hypothetical protein AAFR51_15600 [Pseudomonadota bacterium]